MGPSQTDVVPNAVTAGDNSPAESASLATTSTSGDNQAITAPASPAVDVASTVIVPAAADNSRVEEPQAAAIVLPTEPAPVHDSVPDVLPVAAAAAAPPANVSPPAIGNISTVPTAAVVDCSAPSAVTPADKGASSVIQQTLPPAQGSRTTAFSPLAARLPASLAHAATNMAPWAQTVPGMNGSSASGPAIRPTTPDRAAQDQVTAAFADQLRAYDAVLASGTGTSSAEEPSWLADVTGMPVAGN